MRRFDWHMPVQLHFGPALQALDPALGERGVVVLAYADALQHEAPVALRAALGSRLVQWIAVPDGLGTLAVARRLAEQTWPLLRSASAPVLLAVGGGTVMDLAKLLRCRPLDHDFEALAQSLRGEGPWPAMDRAALWLVPTTAGTGSEVTRWATVWDTDRRVALKRSFDEPFGHAERAFVDPAFSRSCPVPVMRDAALDAFAHALEALWNRHANPVSDVLALSAARRIIDALPEALEDPSQPWAREALSLAATEAGLAFAQTRTALAHSLSYALTLEQGVPHGLACAVWLPTAWTLARGHDPRLDTRLDSLFHAPGDARAAALCRWLREVGVDPDPGSLGVPDAQARVGQALGSERGRNFIGATAQHPHD